MIRSHNEYFVYLCTSGDDADKKAAISVHGAECSPPSPDAGGRCVIGQVFGSRPNRRLRLHPPKHRPVVPTPPNASDVGGTLVGFTPRTGEKFLQFFGGQEVAPKLGHPLGDKLKLAGRLEHRSDPLGRGYGACAEGPFFFGHSSRPELEWHCLRDVPS